MGKEGRMSLYIEIKTMSPKAENGVKDAPIASLPGILEKFEVSWRHHRCCLEIFCPKRLAIIPALWESPIFAFMENADPCPEIISVNFLGVICDSVFGAQDQPRMKALMYYPKNPLTTPLFNFMVHAKMPEKSVEVSMIREPGRTRAEESLMFMRVLEICTRNFYKPGEVVFHHRDYVNLARHDYFLWSKKRDTPRGKLHFPRVQHKWIQLVRSEHRLWGLLTG